MQQSDRNAFLAELSAPDDALFHSHLTSFDLKPGARLQGFAEAIDQVVFPTSGLIAMTMPPHGGAILLGRDGILGGCGAAASSPAMCNAEVHISGRAARMPASAFRNFLDRSPGIWKLATRFNAALIVQAHQTALCNAAHPLEARICRRLLEIQDRIGTGDIPLTQRTMAQMLGVQRTTVCFVAGHLEAAGIIKCLRGRIQVINREEVEGHACECYGNIKAYVSRLFPMRDAPLAGTGKATDGGFAAANIAPAAAARPEAEIARR